VSKTTDNEAFIRTVQEWLGVTVDGWGGVGTMSAFLEKTGHNGVKVSDIPDGYWPLLAQIESGNRPYVKAPTSSASGLYQFIKSTWIGEGGAWGSNMADAFGGLRPSEAEQLQRAKSFTEKNASALRKAGIPINAASLYAAHFLGVGTAIKVIGADVNADAGALAGSAAANANPTILKGKTVGQFLAWLHRKTGAWAR
jgi:hypothetical protein